MGNMFRCTLKSGGASGTGIPLIVTCSEDFAGKTITATDGTTTLTQTCPSTSPYTVQFDLPNTGSWTISGVIEGQTYSETIAVTEYQLALNSGFDYETWVSLGGLDPDDYASLSAVFADEAAVRRLMLVHASADYLIAKVSNDITVIDDFCANDTAMKWLGLCDYVCDGLTAITGVEAKLLASTYWERYLKDHVPTMTSNTAPYGTASATSTYSGSGAYKSFDGLDTDYWSDNSGAVGSTQRIWYQFTNPICVKKIKLTSRTPSNASSMKIVASNDGTNWVDIKAVTDVTASVEYTLDVSDSANAGYYLYYGLEMVKASTSSIGLESLQFYGRSLDVSVPTMTSSVLPYGEVISTDTSPSSHPNWHAFDDSDSTYWSTSGQNMSQIGYKFASPVKIKRIRAMNTNTANITWQVRYSDDGITWVDVTGATITTSASAFKNTDINVAEPHQYWAIGSTTSGTTASMATLNFYGVSYSEKEFEAGTTKKWIYDHGLELVNLSTNVVGSGSVAEEKNDSLYCEIANSTNRYAGFYTTASIDITPYSLLRCVIGDELYLSDGSTSVSAGGIAITTIVPPSYNTAVDATVGYMAGSNPYTVGVDVSSFDASYYIVSGLANVSSSKGRKNTVKEIWLE